MDAKSIFSTNLPCTWSIRLSVATIVCIGTSLSLRHHPTAAPRVSPDLKDDSIRVERLVAPTVCRVAHAASPAATSSLLTLNRAKNGQTVVSYESFRSPPPYPQGASRRVHEGGVKPLEPLGYWKGSASVGIHSPSPDQAT
jgi:hypothetical protein